MIQNIYITNPIGETLQLNLRSSLDDHGLLVFNLTGLGSPKATVSGLSGPTYDGISGAFVRADARHLLLTLAVPVRADAEEVAKAKIYEFFPVKEEVTFRIATESEDVYTIAVIESVEANQFSKVENFVISLYSPDPYFYDHLDRQGYAFYAGSSRTIAYKGASPTGGLFTIYCGETWSWGGSEETMGELIITNDLNDQRMTIFFVTFAIGDQYIIDSRFGIKSVTHIAKATGVETDVTADIDPTSDWIRLYNGNNNIDIVIDGVYQGPSSGRPSDASLEVFLPMNEAPSGDPLELDGDIPFNEVAPPVMNDTGIVYPKARLFVPGDGGYLKSVGTHSKLSPADTFSFCVWLKARAWPGWTTIIRALHAGSNGWSFRVGGDPGDAMFTIISGGSSVNCFRQWRRLDTWDLFFVWYTGGVNKRMYVTFNLLTDGAGIAQNPPDPYTSGWYIGGYPSGEIFDGQMGPIAFYDDYIFTTAHRTWLYNSGKGRTYAELTLGTEVALTYKKRHAGV